MGPAAYRLAELLRMRAIIKFAAPYGASRLLAGLQNWSLK
jgi:hypothetical protein